MELEKEDKIITLDQGLLTVIPGKIIKEGYKDNWWGTAISIQKIDTRNGALVNLLSYEAFISGEHPYNRAYFRPLLIKLIIQQPHSYIENLGIFHKKTHREAKEAIRQKQALYYTRKQGILIYSLSEQPDPSICKHIDRMLEDNKSKMTIPQQ